MRNALVFPERHGINATRRGRVIKRKDKLAGIQTPAMLQTLRIKPQTGCCLSFVDTNQVFFTNCRDEIRQYCLIYTRETYRLLVFPHKMCRLS